MSARYNGGHGGRSRRYHVKHTRALSHYRRRLEARGLTRAPALMPLDVLRRRQSTDAWLTAHPWVTVNLKARAREAVELAA